MSTAQQLLDDVSLRYRHTFTTAQVLVWFNEEQRELFDVLELDSSPYNFITVADENFYPFPDQFDTTKIKVVTYQMDDTDDPNYVEIPFKRNDDNQYAGSSVWYTIASDAFYLHVDDSVPASRNVYIYCDSDPDEVTTANVSSAPNLPTRFQEILKLGVLKRIAGARKDVTFQNNFSMEREEKLSDIIWQKKLAEPEWTTPIDTLPRVGNGWYYNNRRAIIITQTE